MPPSKTPPVPPVPIWSVPPEFRLIVLEVVRESVPPTVTRPPFRVSVPLPTFPIRADWLMAIVPPETVTVPLPLKALAPDPAEASPRLRDFAVMRPPVMASVAVPEEPITADSAMAIVPPETVTADLLLYVCPAARAFTVTLPPCTSSSPLFIWRAVGPTLCVRLPPVIARVPDPLEKPIKTPPSALTVPDDRFTKPLTPVP